MQTARLVIMAIITSLLSFCDLDVVTNHDMDEETRIDIAHDLVLGNGGDLSIRFIQRLPEIDYVWGSTNPAREGWPEVGQEVVWRAHIKNWDSESRSDVGYTWYLDDVEAASGSVDISADGETTVDFPWSWTFDRHMITVEVDPQGLVDEEVEDNNRLSVYTDAITVGFYVENAFYDRYRHLWDDWLQMRIGQWNDMLEDAVFPETPDGVLDRIRIDKIVTMPDGSLPSMSCESLDDRTVDLVWGFPQQYVATYYNVIHGEAYESTLHELGHARYLVDTYGFRVDPLYADDVIEIRENGKSIIDSPYLPEREPYQPVHETPFLGLMHTISPGNQDMMDRYGAVAMNLIAGHRATVGNYAEPENMGVFMNDLPKENRLTVKNSSGDVLPGADVRIYQSVPRVADRYAKYFDDEPDLFFTADEDGQVLLGRNPFHTGGPILFHFTFGSNAVAIVRVEHEGRVGYGFLEVGWFNLAYWRGETEFADDEIIVPQEGLSSGVY